MITIRGTPQTKLSIFVKILLILSHIVFSFCTQFNFFTHKLNYTQKDCIRQEKNPKGLTLTPYKNYYFRQNCRCNRFHPYACYSPNHRHYKKKGRCIYNRFRIYYGCRLSVFFLPFIMLCQACLVRKKTMTNL